MCEVLIDFETISGVDLKVVGAQRYAEDVTTEVLVAGYTMDGERMQWIPNNLAIREGHLRGLAEDPDVIFVAHGVPFERAIWSEIMVKVYSFPQIPTKRWRCTLASAAYHSLPMDLDVVTRTLGLPEHKDMEGSKITRDLSKFKKGYHFQTPELIQKALDYNLQDLTTEAGLRDHLGLLPKSEQQVWELDQRINDRGVMIDLPLVAGMRAIQAEAEVPLLAEFRDLTGVNPGQRDKFLDWCSEQGAHLPDLTKKTTEALIGKIEDEGEADLDDDEWWDDRINALAVELTPKVRRALVIRAEIGRASLKKLERMQLVASQFDNRARGLLAYHGAHSGRWSGRLFQPQNFPAATLKGADPEIITAALKGGKVSDIIQYGKPHDVLAKSLRYCLRAAPGRRYVSGDFKTIELRVLLALAGQWDKVDLILSGASPYIDMAESIYDKPHGSLTKEANPVEYDIGKHTVLGLGYGMGHKKYRMMYARTQTPEFCKKAVATYRDEWAPLVKEVWWAFESAALHAASGKGTVEAYGCEFKLEDKFVTVRLPSGRKLWFYDPYVFRKEMPWSTPEEPDVRLVWRYIGVKGGMPRVVDVFGGLLTGHIIQAIARDIMVDAMFKCEVEGFPVVLTVHDEILTEPTAKDADVNILDQVMRDSPAWVKAMNIPVAASLWIGDRYRKE